MSVQNVFSPMASRVARVGLVISGLTLAASYLGSIEKTKDLYLKVL